MATYQEQKKQLVDLWASHGMSQKEIECRLSGMQEAETILEERLRNLLSPYASITQVLGTLIDTKKESKREGILNYLLESPSLIPELKSNLQTLINVTRL